MLQYKIKIKRKNLWEQQQQHSSYRFRGSSYWRWNNTVVYKETTIGKGVTEDSFDSSVVKDEPAALNKILDFRVTALEGHSDDHVELDSEVWILT